MRIGGKIIEHHSSLLADCGTGRSLPLRALIGEHRQSGQKPLVFAGPGHRLHHSLRGIVLADPDQSELSEFRHHPANRVQQLLPRVGADHRLVHLAERGIEAAEPPDFPLGRQLATQIRGGPVPPKKSDPKSGGHEQRADDQAHGPCLPPQWRLDLGQIHFRHDEPR